MMKHSRRSPGSRFRLRDGLALALLLLCSSTARGEEDFDELNRSTIFRWERWQKGVDLGVRGFGRFGKAGNINAVPGSVQLVAGGHIWWNHLVSLGVNLGHAVTSSTLVYGLGLKLNLLEFVDDPTGETYMRGIQRGLLTKALPNFMIFLGVEYTHISFPAPPAGSGLTYPTSMWLMQPAMGVQWYFKFPQKFAQRFYVETSGNFAVSQGNKYLGVVLSFGAELK